MRWVTSQSQGGNFASDVEFALVLYLTSKKTLKMKSCVQHTINRTVITAYDQFIFILIILRKYFGNFTGIYKLEHGVRKSLFRYWINENGLTSNRNLWVVGSIIDRILLSAQIQRELNPLIREIDNSYSSGSLFLFNGKKNTEEFNRQRYL